MIKNIIILGPPGAGKGTISDALMTRTQRVHISTGSIFRSEIRAQSPLGLQVQQIVKTGKYVPDEITNKIVINALQTPEIARNGFILDGFPRTVNQAQFLETNNIQIELAILLKIDPQIILARLTGRRTCPTCKRIYNVHFSPPKLANQCDNDGTFLVIREDDKPAKITKRLAIYQQETAILRDYYAKKNVILEVDSSQDLHAIIEQIEDRIL